MNSVNKRNRRPALIIATISSFITPFMGASINIALPSIRREFEMNAVMLNWVATSYFLAAAIFLVPFGKTADILGRKKIFTYGISIYTVSSLLLVLSTSGIVLIYRRFFLGRVRITSEYYPVFLKSVKVAFFIFFILCLGGIFASLARGKSLSKE